ncbi:hypothetical protein ABTZ03_34635 [Kitasatospora sp. NPDC096077]|uniref:hypothetical protein n=1 Tax=Kitasatospora sp. NPDC096077 TaxID=3155544 RepID=UPI003321A5C3
MTMPEDSVPLQDTPPTPEPRPQQPPKPSPKPRRSAGELLRAAAPAVLLVVGLALTVLGFVRFTETYQQTRAYLATTVCAADAKPGADCVTLESGRVTKKQEEAGSDSTDYLLTVAREKAPSDRYGVGRAFYEDVDTGTYVELKILHGKVFELSYQGHSSRPPNTPYLAVVEFSVLIAFGMIMMVLALSVDDVEFMLPLALGYVLGTAIATGIGSLTLIALQWPLAVTLAIAVVLWLIVAAVSRATFEGL